MEPWAWFITTLAVSALGDTWHHGSLFAEHRARLEVRNNWKATLLLCPFCLSHHLALLGVLGYFVLRVPYSLEWGLLPVYWLAVVKGASLLRTWLPIDISQEKDL